MEVLRHRNELCNWLRALPAVPNVIRILHPLHLDKWHWPPPPGQYALHATPQTCLAHFTACNNYITYQFINPTLDLTNWFLWLSESLPLVFIFILHTFVLMRWSGSMSSVCTSRLDLSVAFCNISGITQGVFGRLKHCSEVLWDWWSNCLIGQLVVIRCKCMWMLELPNDTSNSVQVWNRATFFERPYIGLTADAAKIFIRLWQFRPHWG